MQVTCGIRVLMNSSFGCCVYSGLKLLLINPSILEKWHLSVVLNGWRRDWGEQPPFLCQFSSKGVAPLQSTWSGEGLGEDFFLLLEVHGADAHRGDRQRRSAHKSKLAGQLLFKSWRNKKPRTHVLRLLLTPNKISNLFVSAHLLLQRL